MTQEEEKKKEDCPECHMDELLIALGVAHHSCSSMGSDEEKEACREWAKSIDPTNVNSAVEVYKKILERNNGDVRPLKETSQTYNLGIELAIIEFVNDKREQGVEVPGQLQNLYKEIMLKRGI